MSGRWSARPQGNLLQPQSWKEPFPCHPEDIEGLVGRLGTRGWGKEGDTKTVVGSTTCNTALMSRRSSAGFQRPRSLVTCSGCLLFFTRLVSPGAGAGLGGTGVLGALDT